jgi:hypothetical protein
MVNILKRVLQKRLYFFRSVAKFDNSKVGMLLLRKKSFNFLSLPKHLYSFCSTSFHKILIVSTLKASDLR